MEINGSMDIDLDLLFGFTPNQTGANNSHQQQHQQQITTATTTVQLTPLQPTTQSQSNDENSNKTISQIIQQQIQNSQQSPQHQIQLTNVTLTNETMQQLQQNRTNIVVLTPVHTGHTLQTIGQVIGNSSNLNLTSVQLSNVPLMPPEKSPVKDSPVEICKIQLITLTDKMGNELKTSYRVVKTIPSENANTKKDNFRVKGSNTVYNCQMCPYKTPKIKSIKEHLVNHKQYTDAVKCRYCDYYSPYTLTLQQHEVIHREYVPLEAPTTVGVVVNGDSDAAPIQTTTVKLKGYGMPKEKKNKCEQCPYRTVKKRDLLLHQLNHTFREGYLKCRYCEYYLLNTKGMKQHEILHGVIEPETINVSFYKKSDEQIPIEPELENNGNNECLKLETIVLKDKSNNDYTASYYVVKSLPNPKNTTLIKNTNPEQKSSYREKGSGTSYRCAICPYTTKYSTHLREHLPNHKLYPGAIKCRYCVYYASNSLNAKQHELLHPEYEPDINALAKKEKFKHRCKMCPFEAPHPYLIQRHSQNHIYKEGYAKCKHCDYYLVNSNNMNQHEILHRQRGLQEIRSLIENKKHQCKICPFYANVKSQFEKHMKFHSRKNFNIKKGFYQCKYCKYYSESSAKIKEHEQLHPIKD